MNDYLPKDTWYNEDDGKFFKKCLNPTQNPECKKNQSYSSLAGLKDAVKNKRLCKNCGIISSAKKRSKTKSKFISEAVEIWGDKFDYSEVVYRSTHVLVNIRCIEHNHVFSQDPSSHLAGHEGCEFCGGGGKHSTENFIKKARMKHGGYYDYSKVEYDGADKKVTIICPIHGDFNIVATTHLSGNKNKGSGCYDCGLKKISDHFKKTQNEIIALFKGVHGDYYDYSITIYDGYHKPFYVKCPIHKKVRISSPANHIAGKGCNDCGNLKIAEKLRMKKSEFIKKARFVHGYTYDYSKVKLVNHHTKIIINCPHHGDFDSQTPDSHLHGHGCNDCGGSKKLTQEEFISKSKEEHGDRYDYTEVVYKNSTTRVKIICRIHGEFEMYPSNHYRKGGSGCGKCKNKAESKIAEYFKEIGIQWKEKKINNRAYDFYLPDYNMLIERDGEQHYMYVKYFKKPLAQNHAIDIEKTNIAIKNGFRIARIPYWLKFDEVKIEIHNILDGTPSYPIIPNLEHESLKPKPKI